MGTAKVFRSGNSQAVRLPKQFRLKSGEVEIFRRGDEIVLREKDGIMVRALDVAAASQERGDSVLLESASLGLQLGVSSSHLFSTDSEESYEAFGWKTGWSQASLE
jgi:antitoxin VapB